MRYTRYWCFCVCIHDSMGADPRLQVFAKDGSLQGFFLICILLYVYLDPDSTFHYGGKLLQIWLTPYLQILWEQHKGLSIRRRVRHHSYLLEVLPRFYAGCKHDRSHYWYPQAARLVEWTPISPEETWSAGILDLYGCNSDKRVCHGSLCWHHDAWLSLPTRRSLRADLWHCD